MLKSTLASCFLLRRNLLPGTLAYNDRVLAIPRVPPQSEEEVQRIIDQVGGRDTGRDCMGGTQQKREPHCQTARLLLRSKECAGVASKQRHWRRPLVRCSPVLLQCLCLDSRGTLRPVQVLAGSQSSHISGEGIDALQSDDEENMF